MRIRAYRAFNKTEGDAALVVAGHIRMLAGHRGADDLGRSVGAAVPVFVGIVRKKGGGSAVISWSRNGRYVWGGRLLCDYH